MSDLAPGTVVAGHRIEGVAGRGGMGVVYRATHLRLNRVVALKIVAPQLAVDPDFRARFTREAHTAASIDHPNVVTVYDAGEADGLLYMTMRFVEGSDLGAVVGVHGPMPPAHAVQVIAQVAAGLDAAHSRGLVHRDVKPGNILVDHQWRVYLGDFGLSRLADGSQSLTRTGVVVGTAQYAAPEQLLAKPVDARSDVYSLGCVLYFALTGMPPFAHGGEPAIMFAHMSAERPAASAHAPAVPRALDAVIQRAMAVEPAGRYATAGEMAQAAYTAVTAPDPAPTRTHPAPPPPVPTPPPAPPPPPPVPPSPTAPPAPVPARARRGRTGLWIALAGGAAALAAVVALLLAAGLAGDSGSGPVGPTSDNPTVDRTIDVGSTPVGIVARDDAVWVSNAGADTVTRIDAEGAQATATGYAGDSPHGLEIADDALWVAGDDDSSLHRLDPATLAPTGAPFSVGSSPRSIQVVGGDVWVADFVNDTLLRVSSATGEVTATTSVYVGGNTHTTDVGEGSVWVANYGEDAVTRVDPSTGAVVTVIGVGGNPRGVAVGEGAAWVTNEADNSVSRIDAQTNQVTDTVYVGTSPGAIAVADGIVWVANAEDDTVTRIDADSRQVVGSPIVVGDNPAAVAVGGGAVWVANADSSTVSRIR